MARIAKKAAAGIAGTVALTACVLGIAACPKMLTHGPLLDVDPSAQALLIAGGTVLDTRRGVYMGERDVYTLGPRIVAVLPVGERAPEGFPERHRRIEAAGRYVMPGMVDAHTHIAGDGAAPWLDVDVSPEENLESYLRAGITTVFDLGGDGDDLEALKAKVTAGTVPGPRIFHTHLPITAPGAHPIPLVKELLGPPLSWLVDRVVPQVESAQDAADEVKNVVAHRADYVKVMYDALPDTGTQMDASTLKHVVDAAHRAQKKVVVHIGSIDNALDAARAGADLLAHGVYRSDVTAAQAEELASYRIPMIFTLVGWEITEELGQGRYAPSDMDRAWIAEEQYAALTEPLPPLTPVFTEFIAQVHRDHALWRPNAKRLYDAGVPMWVGTDSSLPGIYPGASYHQELRRLSAAGIDNGALLRGATLAPAQWLGHDPLFGIVQAGALADLLVVDEDPLADVAALATLRHIVAEGRLYAPR